jgi:hypothetical protein
LTSDARAKELVSILVFIAALLAIGVSEPRYGIVAVPVAFAVYLVISLSPRGRLSESLKELEGRMIDIRVWGQSLPTRYRLKSVRYFGASLRLFFRSDDEALTELKIAGAGNGSMNAGGAEIRDAAYVQWAGRKLDRIANSPAVTLTVVQ